MCRCRFFVLEDRSATQKSETKGSKNWKPLDNCVLWPWRTPHPQTDWKAFRQQVLSAGKATSSGSLRDICWWHLWCESAAVCTWVTRVRCGRKRSVPGPVCASRESQAPVDPVHIQGTDQEADHSDDQYFVAHHSSWKTGGVPTGWASFKCTATRTVQMGDVRLILSMCKLGEYKSCPIMFAQKSISTTYPSSLSLPASWCRLLTPPPTRPSSLSKAFSSRAMMSNLKMSSSYGHPGIVTGIPTSYWVYQPL